MTLDTTTGQVREIMLDYARNTGIEPVRTDPQRYLWTDAFAVCNYLELFRRTDDQEYRDLALRLVDQVHRTLGRHRDDDLRKGWIGGLTDKEGEMHPTQGGLRIGKPLPERLPWKSFEDPLEWDRDGQYFHYLTRWMHALACVSRVTGDKKYLAWAVELAHTAHARFTYRPHSGGRKRMYWKMSIDLTCPLVPTMGQHDPLDGFVTYSELQANAMHAFGKRPRYSLDTEITDIADICRGAVGATTDPLGTGGLLWDASWIAQLMTRSNFRYGDLLESVVDSAMQGVTSFAADTSLSLPAEYRLAFRELGLSIGLKGVCYLQECIRKNPELSNREYLLKKTDVLTGYLPLADAIERFWTNAWIRNAGKWTEHREINEVMMATSLAPDMFLSMR